MNDTENVRILFAGGGTAGHLMPAINIAGELRNIENRISPLFVGKRGGMEKEIVRKFGFEIEEIDVIGMRRSPMGIVRFILHWNRSNRQAMDIARKYNPMAVVGTGGYVSAPSIRAGHRMGKRIFIQEQNSLPGLATRSMARYADTIFIAYESAAGYLGKSRCELTGNPIRSDIRGRDRNASVTSFALDPGLRTLLILGGSSGASSINKAVGEIIGSGLLPGGWQFLWQTGQRDFEKYRGLMRESGFPGSILPFIDDMPAAYASADLVLSRAGAMALSEITAMGLPSVLIPYPHATGDHQTLNAGSLGNFGAAIVIGENEMESRLKPELTRLFSDEKARRDMSAAAAALGRPNAAREIAQKIWTRLNEI